jgi:hypothetical protein
VSSVRYLFASDIQYSSIEYSEKVIVPLIVLRNHQRFDPLSQVGGGTETLLQGTFYFKCAIHFMIVFMCCDVLVMQHTGAAGPVNDLSIDLKLIREEIESMLLPGQQLVLVPSIHHLHEHHHISTSVWKAFKGDTVHTATVNGIYRAKTIPYLDTAILSEELHHAADVFTMGLIQSQHHSHAAATSIGDTTNKNKAIVGHRILPVCYDTPIHTSYSFGADMMA